MALDKPREATIGKVVKIVAIVALVAVAVFAPQIAGAVLGALSVSSAVATAVLAAAITIGASVAVRALIGVPTSGRPTSQGSLTPIVIRQSVSDSFILYGERRVINLKMVFHHAKDVGSVRTLYFVFAIAGHRCQAVTQWMLNEAVVTVNGSNMVTTGPYAGSVWLWFQRGLATETANATFVAECEGKWTSDHIGHGVAAIYMKMEATNEVIQEGFCTPCPVVQGRDEIYDYRTDTEGYTDNAILVFYDFMQMAREEGGYGAYPDEIPDADFISSQANICDEDVEGDPRYTLNGPIVTGAPPDDIRDVMIACFAGTYAYSGGKHLAKAGAFVPLSARYGEDDFAGPIQVSDFFPADQAATEVQGTYVEPAHNYQGAPFATQSVSSDDVRQLNIDLPFVTLKHQAERVASIMLKRAQAERTGSVVLDMTAIQSCALDTIHLDTQRYNISNLVWQVAHWGLTHQSDGLSIGISVREENEDIYLAPDVVPLPTVDEVSTGNPIGSPTDADKVSVTPSGGITETNVQDALVQLDTLKAPKASPALTGTPTSPTAAPGTNTTQIATTAFVTAAVAAGSAVKRALVKKAANQTTANYTTEAAVAWDSEVYDADNLHSNVTNNSRLTVPANGYARVWGEITLNALAVGEWARVVIKKGGVVFDGGGLQMVYGDALTATYANVQSAVVEVTAGEYFELFLLVESDASVTVAASQSGFAIETWT